MAVSRTQRLFDLMQILRSHRRPVSGAALASALGISLRTLYRDVELLKAQGATVDGEAGIGYILRPGFMLPPLMFSEDELEAMMLGSRWVAERADPELARAARGALAKISSVLPADLRISLDTSTLYPVPTAQLPAGTADLAHIRVAIRQERKLQITYGNQLGSVTERTLWPIAIAFFERVRIVAGWCELRQSFRHFRTDRIHDMQVLDDRIPRHRQTLLKEWRAVAQIPEQ